jgi:NADPH:quinone reductase-like Zn-dependent oxidoreductase
MSALHLKERAVSPEDLRFDMLPDVLDSVSPDECLVEVKATGVNMSDVKAVLGQMPHAVWPRTPGRDYAGVVVKGPSELLGKEVWGSGGELGITRNGTHANYVVVKASTVRVKPSTMSLLEAGALGVPFITAYEGLSRAGFPAKGAKSILVCGANGRVGQAAIQLASAQGLQVFGVERGTREYRGHATVTVDMVEPGAKLSEYVRDKTQGAGVDIVFNTVGSPYFVEAHAAMGRNATQIFISTIERSVPFDIFQFFRAQHTFVGIDTLKLDTTACAGIFDKLADGFESGKLKPFEVPGSARFSLEKAADAYRAVYKGSPDRLVLQP